MESTAANFIPVTQVFEVVYCSPLVEMVADKQVSVVSIESMFSTVVVAFYTQFISLTTCALRISVR